MTGVGDVVMMVVIKVVIRGSVVTLVTIGGDVV